MRAWPVSNASRYSYAGWYEITNNRMIAFTAQHGRLSTLVDGMPDEEFIPTGKGQFRSNSRKMGLAFLVNARGSVTGAAMNADGQQRQLRRSVRWRAP